MKKNWKRPNHWWRLDRAANCGCFLKKGVTTRVAEKLPHLLPSLLDGDMASIIKKYLDNDLIFLLGTTVDAIKGSRHVK